MISDEKIAKQEGIKPTVKRLDLDSIREGVKIMARDYPLHFSNMFNESGDAETGDVLLQCCVFGKIVYG